MKLYLIRHGIAVERGTDFEETERPLTKKGRQKTKKVAQSLDEIGLKFELILTSPLVRAYQTAEILLEVGLTKKVEESHHLAPEGNLQDWLVWLSQWRYDFPAQDLAVVGHQPDLGNWAELLVWGRTTERIVLKKAGVIGLDLPNSGEMLVNSELFLLTSPKFLCL